MGKPKTTTKILQIIPALGWNVVFENDKDGSKSWKEPVVCWALTEVTTEEYGEITESYRDVIGMMVIDGKFIEPADELGFTSYEHS